MEQAIPGKAETISVEAPRTQNRNKGGWWGEVNVEGNRWWPYFRETWASFNFGE